VRPRTTTACAALVALLGGGAALAADPSPEALLAAKAETVVTVRMVMKVRFQFLGQSGEREQTFVARGAVVDPTGLVVVQNDAVGGDSTGATAALLKQFDGSMSATATDVRILFGDGAEERPAVLVARDSTLDLAYVQATDLGERRVAAVDFARAPEARTGDALFLVTRKRRAFDCAPLLLRCYPSMRVEQPRPMWQVTGDVVDRGLPLYDAAGRFAGIVVSQAGSEGGNEENPFANTGTFLLPPAVVEKSVAAARAKVPEALAAAKASRAEPAPASGDGEPPAPERPR
jgi:hypothetical protein